LIDNGGLLLVDGLLLAFFGLLNFKVALASQAQLQGRDKVDEAGRVELPENLLKQGVLQGVPSL
jgi:hypothetical protein